MKIVVVILLVVCMLLTMTAPAMALGQVWSHTSTLLLDPNGGTFEKAAVEALSTSASDAEVSVTVTEDNRMAGQQ